MKMARLSGLCLVFLIQTTAGIELTNRVTGKRFPSLSWVDYEQDRSAFPQCCQDEYSCKMVRIDQKLINDVQTSGSASYQTKGGSLSIELSSHPTLGGVYGQMQRHGHLYLIEPVQFEERLAEGCSVQGMNMNLFHKRTDLGDLRDQRTIGLPKLFNYVQPTKDSVACANAVFCFKVMPNFENLAHLSTGDLILVPWLKGAGVDDKEEFKVAMKMPPECQGALCNLFYLQSTTQDQDLVVKVDTQEKSVVLGTKQYLYELYTYPRKGSIWTKKFILNQQVQLGKSGGSGVVDGDCWFNQTRYCSVSHNVIDIQEAVGDTCEEMSMDCHQKCLDNNDCEYFTFYMGRGLARCYLLSGCVYIYSASCLEQENCLSGVKECSGPYQGENCTAPAVTDPQYTPWHCADKEGANLDMFSVSDSGEVPSGTICVQRCSNWVTEGDLPGYLESTCNSDGEWTETLPHNQDASLKFPVAPYAEPDAASPPLQTCLCDALSLTWPPHDPTGASYNPDDEVGARFICDQYTDNSTGNFIISPPNECRLFCDDNLFVTVSCQDGRWNGNPDEGFWCYTRPNGNGTCGPNVCGYLSPWSAWNCDINTGLATRYRTCSTDNCLTDNLSEETTCPVDGNWSDWGAWGPVDPTTGVARRPRVCDNPTAKNGGEPCAGLDYEEGDFPVDGDYTDWGPWGTLNTDTGKVRRTRTCTNPTPLNNGQTCIEQGLGPDSEEEDRPVDGNWGDWNDWSVCHLGSRTRTRACDNPSPLNNGAECSTVPLGSLEPDNLCPSDGNWGQWGAWSTCSVNGVSTQERVCDNPEPFNGGAFCLATGLSVRLSRETASTTCPVNGNWGEWGDWGTVNPSNGMADRSRVCNNPPAQNGGDDCLPPATQSQQFPVDGNWGEWGPWGPIDPATGTAISTRVCDNPAPILTGLQCPGDSTQTGNFRVDGNWGDWGVWGEVDTSTGKATRTRVCDNPAVQNGGTPCPGDASETGDFPVDGNWGDWGTWGELDVSTGYVQRNRSCDNPTPLNNGATCPGSATQQEARPVNGGWGEWGEWGTTDEATWQTPRTRACDSPATLNGGTPCIGAGEEKRTETVTVSFTFIEKIEEQTVTGVYFRGVTYGSGTGGNGGTGGTGGSGGSGGSSGSGSGGSGSGGSGGSGSGGSGGSGSGGSGGTGSGGSGGSGSGSSGGSGTLFLFGGEGGGQAGSYSYVGSWNYNNQYTFTSPNTYYFAAVADGHIQSAFTVDMACDFSACATSQIVDMYASYKPFALASGQVSVSMLWMNYEDADLNVAVIPYTVTPDDWCRKYWGSDGTCDGIDYWPSDSKWTTSGCRHGNTWCNETVVVNTNTQAWFAIGVEDAQLSVGGATLIVETSSNYGIYEVPAGVSQTSTGWFFGCVNGGAGGVEENYTPNSYDPTTLKHTLTNPVFFEHELKSSWNTNTKNTCNNGADIGRTAGLGRNIGWADYDFDKPKGGRSNPWGK